MNETIIICTVVLALASVVSPIIACMAAIYTKRASEGSLVVGLLDEYSSEKMKNNLRILAFHMGEKDYATYWEKALQNEDENAQREDTARREVVSYFMKILFLYENKHICERTAKELCSFDGINVVFGVIESMEQALNPKYRHDKFRKLRSISFVGYGIDNKVPPSPKPL